MALVNLTINGQKIQANSEETILQAAEKAGIRIPVLCHHPSLPPDGVCRICLVEIQNQRLLQPACKFPVSEGMVVNTDTPKIRASRKTTLELLIAGHPLACMTCESTGNCRLQDLAYEYDIQEDHFDGDKHRFAVDDPNPFIQVDRNKCIVCGLCVRACRDVNGVEAITMMNRGFRTYIGFGADGYMADSTCEFCGSCVAVCPTGALWPKIALGKGRSWQVERVQTTCPYCGVGCQLNLEIKDNKIVMVDSAWGGPSNHGWTCVKGRFGWDFVHHPDRLTRPKVRRYLLDESLSKPSAADRHPEKAGDLWEWVETEWDTALEISARKFRQHRDESGPDSIGVLTSAKCLNEENYLMNKFTRQAIGTNSIDHCARL